LTVGTGEEVGLSLSRDGKVAVYSTVDESSDILVLDRSSGLRSKISGATDESDPAIAPDGAMVAFVSNRRGGYDLWLQPLLDARVHGSPRRLKDHRGSIAVPAFSRDGQWLAYTHLLDGQRDVWIAPTTGGVSRQFTEHGSADFNPTFSPDGSTLAFISDRSGVGNIWLARVEEGRRVGEARQVTDSDVSHWFPVWSPDGKRIASVVQRENESEVYVVEVGSGSPEHRVTTGAGARRVRWATSGDELLVSGTWGSSRISLWVVSLQDHSARPFEPAVDFGLDEFGAGAFCMGSEGRILAYEVVDRRGDIWLAETNFGLR
jgi:TolB protein